MPMEGCCQPQGPLEAFWDLERYLDAAGAARVGLAEVELTIRSLADLERAQPLLLASYESS
jgi:hypothetical protein